MKNDIDYFIDYIEKFSVFITHSVGYKPSLSRQYLEDARRAWIDDISRVSDREMSGEELDHFKHASHLCFWLRRMGPILEVLQIDPGIPPDTVGDKGKELELILKYRNEYLAFQVGLFMCGDFEADDKHPKIDHDYLLTFCHFMRYKHVSPHAIFLIYKSLFVAKEVPYFSESYLEMIDA
ncbi:MAG: hypothetical protein HQL81_01880 [Magnetococcales bacterium]|nr:hypothetical protein [Magnetococcales bacterium]